MLTGICASYQNITNKRNELKGNERFVMLNQSGETCVQEAKPEASICVSPFAWLFLDAFSDKSL